MIVFSAGMQKSGTGWYFRLTNELLATHGGADTRVIREESPLLKRVVKPHNCSIGAPSARRVATLLVASAGKPTFAVKTHASPSATLQRLLRTRAAYATYCYRDLRDVALSALDAANAAEGKPGPRMAKLRTVEDAAQFAASLVPTWRAWTSTEGVLPVRYEELRSDPARELERLASFLGIQLAEDAVKKLLVQYPAGAVTSEAGDELHFNKGEAGRFLATMTRSDLDICNRVLGPALQEMGYELV